MEDVNTKDTIFEPDFFPFACSPFYTSSIIYQPLSLQHLHLEDARELLCLDQTGGAIKVI